MIKVKAIDTLVADDNEIINSDAEVIKLHPSLFVVDTIELIHSLGKQVFYDAKIIDTPSSASREVKYAISKGADIISVHSLGGLKMLEAVASISQGKVIIFGVTVLTSLDQHDLFDMGFSLSVSNEVDILARLCGKAGINGVVCSPLEVAAVKRASPRLLIACPGVNLKDADHKRAGVTDVADYIISKAF
jgi:orotidine-5'-phosphate decarboxylase